jgi:2-oxoisovalerate dehydrogenase E1 component
MDTAYQGTVSTDLVAKAMLIRAVEERLLTLFSEGKLFGTVHTCIGQEWTGVAVAEALVEGDLIFSNHRCHGHYLARTGDVDGLIAEIMGKQTGICGGRGGSQHLCAHGFFSNGVQGGIAPVSAGLAMAQKINATGNVAVCFIGDGTLGEGALYESLNVASKWSLPLLIVLENNGYSQSTAQGQTLAGSIRDRAGAFAIETAHANTWDPGELIGVMDEAVRRVRAECRPAFVQVDTYRLMAHSKGDDDRDAAEVEGYWAKDPLVVFAQENVDLAATFAKDHDLRIDAAVTAADDAPYTDVATTGDEVQAFQMPRWIATEFEATGRVVNRIHAALERNMEKDDRIVLLGEDIEGPYGGAFKATKDLNARFPGRVWNTPISEGAITGIGNGMAMAGLRPVCELMFGDFMTLAADQLINHASKFRYMYNEQVSVPMVVRTPMGGKRGYGATHSQSLEKHFLGLPGTQMIALHHRCDPADLYDAIFAELDRPTIVIENKLLYGARVSSAAPEGFALEHTEEPFPTTRLRPEGDADVTVLCYGGMLPDAEEAAIALFEEHEIVCEILCPTQLYPFNPWPIAQSLHRTGCLVTVEEGLSFAAFGAEAIAQLHECAPGYIQHVRRVAPPRHPIPSCGPLEKEVLPGASHIIAAVREMVAL